MTQTAYQVLCEDTDGNTLWDTGKVTGSSMRAQYAGQTLESRDRVGAWGIRNQYGTETRLTAQLEILYADGSRQAVITDDSCGSW